MERGLLQQLPQVASVALQIKVTRGQGFLSLTMSYIAILCYM